MGNLKYMNETSKEKMESDPYWEHVHYIIQQLKGLYDGYNSVAEKDKTIDFEQFLVLSSYVDAKDAKNYVGNEVVNFKEMTTEEIRKKLILNSHCSELVKLANDYSDLWFGHSTWDYYNVMIRIFKEYRFVTNKGNEKSKINAFSSYPAILYSTDDFYYLDSKLLVTDTSINIMNLDLYKNLNKTTIFTWVKIILANRLAKSAEEWSEIFKKDNSGTYNSQFTILDLNKIDLNNKIIKDKALMIIEQIPGSIEIEDVTELLRNKYWASYNLPYINEIYKKCGYEESISENPDLKNEFDYNECYRAKIFEREQKNINSNEDMKKLMRLNKYQSDEYSDNDPRNSISCRYDLLNKDNEEIHCYGGSDAKFVSIKDLMEGKKLYIISGPTNDNQPPFSWETTKCIEKQKEQFYQESLIKTWNFTWIEYKMQLEDLKKESGKDVENKDEEKKKNKLPLVLIIVGATIIVVVIVIIIFIFFFMKKNKRITDDINSISYKDEDKLINETEDDLLQ